MLNLLVAGQYDIPGELNKLDNKEQLAILKRMNLTLPTVVRENKIAKLIADYEAKGKDITPAKRASFANLGTKAGNNSLLQVRQLIKLHKTLSPRTRLNRIMAQLGIPEADIARIMESPLVDGVREAPRELWFVTHDHDTVINMGNTDRFNSCFSPWGMYHRHAQTHARNVRNGHAVMVYQKTDDGKLANRFLIRDQDNRVYDNLYAIEGYNNLWVDAVQNLNRERALIVARSLLGVVTQEQNLEDPLRAVITEGEFPFVLYRAR